MTSTLTSVFFKLDKCESSDSYSNQLPAKCYAMNVIKTWISKFSGGENISFQCFDLQESEKSYSTRIEFLDHFKANYFRRSMSYKETKEYKIVAFWFGIRAAHEVIVNGLPPNISRRKIFKEFEKHGDIGRVTPYKDNPTKFWVAFISSKGAKKAIDIESPSFCGQKLYICMSKKVSAKSG
ncbi:hypothetical protein TVAG_175650 [Trichomonas vaginalis G3]|uniref:RRM domain-containing protein n=1 Tax=Trichomonas vaginalis (strain ATCC PRA-98 / G3) TaxID=412133 RepID=A2F5N3_TRIV3|nr:RNA-binding domain, RBD family [Trichomonas vaginalis G3]EAX99796.1 hypothetical protein TVAG_175650 [Trichomonas vaginalis G3]KAI5494430.1 RNA-binding domain, RBD family [Trichomonas vaginalis G3]|eukprot:XP_001312726.1 hypothetical protein [Trichomonas vaginalis G3]